MSTTWVNRGHLYSPHVRPVLVDCNFIVDKANGNGLGIRSLKGQGVKAVYMTSSATPATGNPFVSGVSEGNILVEFTDNFSRAYPGMFAIVSPVSGSALKIDNGATLTIGSFYTIVIVGNATAAQWRTIGVPAGITPAVGVTFVAAATGAGSGNTASSRVEAQLSTGSGIDHIETIGDPNTTISPIPVGGSPNVGGSISLTTFLDNAITQPADGTVLGLTFYFNQSSVVVAGE